jgi:tetratricopeptide (TPR) repeat protein
MLEEFVRRQPDDPFPRYALAMEHKNAGRLGEASQIFAALMESKPDYTATYLHAGNVLVALGEVDQARRVYESGVAACLRSHDPHARGELEGALAGLAGSG